MPSGRFQISPMSFTSIVSKTDESILKERSQTSHLHCGFHWSYLTILLVYKEIVKATQWIPPVLILPRCKLQISFGEDQLPRCL